MEKFKKGAEAVILFAFFAFCFSSLVLGLGMVVLSGIKISKGAELVAVVVGYAISAALALAATKRFVS